jgi:FkbM family methyltransferase
MNRTRQWLSNKWHAAITLGHFVHLLANWPTVWMCRHNKKRLLPSLRFRNGLILNHGKYDDPLLLLDEVFIRRLYDFKTDAPRDGIMVDVGANIGSVTQFFAVASATLQIHAYEPNPAAFEMLQRNIKDNHLEQRVTAFPEAVGRDSGDLSLWVNINTTLSTAYMESSPGEGGRRITVPMVSLDEVWRRLHEAPIWLLKIDTEGAEGDILEGAAKSTLGAVQNAIIEYHDNIVPGVSERCYRVLKASGFKWRTFVHPWNEGIIYASRCGPEAGTTGGAAG